MFLRHSSKSKGRFPAPDVLQTITLFYTVIHQAYSDSPLLEPNGYVYFVSGKDIIIFVTPEDHKASSTVTLPDDDSEPGDLHPTCACFTISVIKITELIH